MGAKPIPRPCCQICHEETVWRVCYSCQGKGDDDLGTPNPCYACQGELGWWQCPNHHYHDEADIRHCI